MRGNDGKQGELFSYVTLEARIPKDHPLRPIRVMVDQALEGLHGDFEEMYSRTGRPSIPPERLLRALLLQGFYSVRSERQLMEQLDYNLLFRWFVGLGVDDAVWHPTTFTQNRERLVGQDIARKFFDQVLSQAREAGLLSSEHFTVDGTFIEAWAGQKSFRRKDGSDDPPGPGRNATADFRGEKRSNETHASTTDPDARLRRKGGEGAKLVHHGHVLSENRHGLVVAAEVSRAEGNAEPEAAVRLAARRGTTRDGTVGADKAYDQGYFVREMRRLRLTPHVAQDISGYRGSMVDGRTTRHRGYRISQRRRKRVEEFFGWMKTVGVLRKARHRGTRLVNWAFELAAAAYNLIRMRSLLSQSASRGA
jgi:transposase